METLITFMSIIVLCCTVYGLMEMYTQNKDHPIACKIIYIHEKQTNIRERRMKPVVNRFTKDQGDFKKYDYLYNV